MGISKSGQQKENYTPGIEIIAKQTVLAEGARGSLSELAMARFKLRQSIKKYINFKIVIPKPTDSD